MLRSKGQQQCMGLQGFGRRGQIEGGNPCNFFSHSPTCTLHFNNSFFDKMADENVSFQDEDARIHDD